MNKFLILIILFAIYSCQQESKELPFIGDRVELDGTINQHEIRAFSFTDQMGRKVTNATLDDKIYMADFFFTSCPSICPKVKKQMLRVYDKILSNDDILLVSHTIDPKRDSVAVLKRYADNMDIDHNKWLFVTGDKEELLDIADDYFVAAYEDQDAPGGFDHSGKILLLDKDGRIRSFSDGTDPESVDQMMKDLDLLLKTYE